MLRNKNGNRGRRNTLGGMGFSPVQGNRFPACSTVSQGKLYYRIRLSKTMRRPITHWRCERATRDRSPKVNSHGQWVQKKWTTKAHALQVMRYREHVAKSSGDATRCKSTFAR